MGERFIVGLGNPTLGDKAIGLKLAEAIATDPDNDDFKTISLPESALDLLQYLDAPVERVLILDTALADREPGETILVSSEEFLGDRQNASFTIHLGDVLKILDLAKELNQKIPRIRILGIQPEKMGRSDHLSPTLEAHFQEYVDTALQLIRADLF